MTSPHPTPEILNQFVAFVGEANVVRTEDDMAGYLTELRHLYSGKASIVLRPGSTDEVSKILKLANDNGIAIVPQGGNTGLVGGQIPFDEGNEIIVSLSRMNSIREIDPEGNTMTDRKSVV